MSDSNSENNNSQGFEWILWGDVYELGKVSETMTSDT